jgi:hypothetical protein
MHHDTEFWNRGSLEGFINSWLESRGIDNYTFEILNPIPKSYTLEIVANILAICWRIAPHLPDGTVMQSMAVLRAGSSYRVVTWEFIEYEQGKREYEIATQILIVGKLRLALAYPAEQRSGWVDAAEVAGMTFDQAELFGD